MRRGNHSNCTTIGFSSKKIAVLVWTIYCFMCLTPFSTFFGYILWTKKIYLDGICGKIIDNLWYRKYRTRVTLSCAIM
jgi:hypothetical protein